MMVAGVVVLLCVEEVSSLWYWSVCILCTDMKHFVTYIVSVSNNNSLHVA